MMVLIRFWTGSETLVVSQGLKSAAFSRVPEALTRCRFSRCEKFVEYPALVFRSQNVQNDRNLSKIRHLITLNMA